MKVSLEWLRDFVELPAEVSADDVARDLTLKTVEVEECVDMAAPLDRVVTGQVEHVEPLDDKGRLLATCDVGSARTVTVVTRVKGLVAGRLVAVALPGARLNRGTGELESSGAGPDSRISGVELAAVEIAGVTSEGAVCTAADLGLQRLFPRTSGDEALDLAELNPKPGSPLADVLGFDDVVLEIDNKSLTNRPDLWGHYGIARELAAIYGVPLKPLQPAARPAVVDGLVGDLDPDLCRRLAVVEFTVGVQASAPFWMRSRLARIGEGTVNLCVDLSNYVMFTVGQPTHVYDADRVALPLSVARTTSPVTLELVTGEGRELPASTPVISDASGPVAVAGVMGGLASGVMPASNRFVLEVATFYPMPIRRASQRLSLRTEASARFEKGLDTQRVDAAVDLFLSLLRRVAPKATVAGMQDVQPAPTPPAQIEVDLDFLDQRVGTELDRAEVRATLTALGFQVAGDDQWLEVTAPTWRSTGDISMPHDIVEEVARLHGYENLPAAPLTVHLDPVRKLNRRPLDRVIREQLAVRAGMQEVVTYPWVADHLLLATGLDKKDTVRFEGAPAPDRDSLRPSLVPNLLEAAVANLRHSQAFGIFEVGEVFAAEPLTPYHGVFEKLPDQRRLVAGIWVGDDGVELFRRAKGVLEMLARYCHLTDLGFTDGETPAWADGSARLTVVADGVPVGAVGLLTARCRRLAGIDTRAACFELDLGGLTAHPSRHNLYEPVPELPEADFDLSVVVPDGVPWRDIVPAVTSSNPLVHRVVFIDEFRGGSVPAGHRSVTLRVVLRPRDVTLTTDTIAAVRAAAIAALARDLGAQLRG